MQSPDANKPSLLNSETVSTAVWMRRLIISLTTLIWIVFATIILWLLSHVVGTVILLIIGSLIAFAIFPVVKLFQHVMPRWLAILIVYIILLSGIGAILYFIALTAINQTTSLINYIQSLLQPGNNQFKPVISFLNRIGLSQAQLQNAGQQLVGQLRGLVGNIVPVVKSIFNIFLDILVVGIVSIYFLVDGERIARWLRRESPLNQRRRVGFLVDTIQRVVGGYIRGDILLALLISVLVGGGTKLIGVPYALLLGIIAFLLEFIPILGTIISGIIAVLFALTAGWLVAAITLLYFLFVHAIEAYIVGPRIIGRAVRLHPLVSLIAVVAGAELYGALGALLASPVAGVVQALIIALWSEWRKAHPDQFLDSKEE